MLCVPWLKVEVEQVAEALDEVTVIALLQRVVLVV